MPRSSTHAASDPAASAPLLDLRTAGIAALVAALAFTLLPSFENMRSLLPAFDAGSTLGAITLFRCLVAGCVAGLSLRRPNPWWACATTAAAGIVLGAIVVALLPAAGVSATGLLWGLPIGCSLACALSWLASAAGVVMAEGLALAMIVVILFSVAGIFPGVVPRAKLRTREELLALPPIPKMYASDTMGYLRAYTLMKQGEGYYPAFTQSIKDNSWDMVIDSPFNYREPFIFYLWKALPGNNGATLLVWFEVYAGIVLICSYVIASSLVARGTALLAPIALIPWFAYASWTTTFPQIDIWAAGFAVAAVMCLVKKWRVPSLILLTAAVAAREFMVLLMPAWLAVAWFSRGRKQTWWFPAAAVIGPVSVLAAHFLAVPPTTGGAGMKWLHGGIDRLFAALRYGFNAMPAGQWIPLALAAAAIGAAAMARPRWKMVALLAVTVLPTLFLLVFSGGPDWDYWGAFYIPLAVAIAPGVLGMVLPPETAIG